MAWAYALFLNTGTTASASARFSRSDKEKSFLVIGIPHENAVDVTHGEAAVHTADGVGRQCFGKRSSPVFLIFDHRSGSPLIMDSQ